jgi:hypothetical protein
LELAVRSVLVAAMELAEAARSVAEPESVQGASLALQPHVRPRPAC